MWSVASQVDMALANCKNDNEVLSVLGTDDRVEAGLRHLGAFFYEQRTHDRIGAAHMRAFSAPGAGKDIMPTWLVSDSTLHSRNEHKRTEMVEAELRRRNKESDPGKGKDQKGAGKGKDKGKKKG